MSESTVESLFLHLLSAAIWDKPVDAACFKNREASTWQKISDMARRQSVNALIADKALSLPDECLPPKPMQLTFLTQIEQTKSINRRLIHVLSQLTEEYAQVDIPFLLLKGLANGINYPSPLLRNPGDLDLFLYRTEDYESSKGWITGMGYEITDGDHIHYKFEREGVSVENHRRITYFDHKKYDRLFACWEDQLREKKPFTTVEIDSVKVQQLPVEMNAFFIFQHMFRHFVHLGVGFRQFCDWLLFLSRYRGEIDQESFTASTSSYALLYPMQVFARAAVKYFDAPEDIFPFEMIPDHKHADRVIADLFESGNFGFHKSGKKRPKQRMRGMWFSYKTTIRRSMRFGAISPEHSLILPYTKLVNRLKIGF